jgi:hypothetical protein
MASQKGRSVSPELGFIWKSKLGGWESPPKFVCVHMLCTQVWWSVIASNVEASGLSCYTHAHALTAVTHACSGLGFL